MNWSYSVALVTKKGVSSHRELLSDLDSLAINVKLLLLGYDTSDTHPFVHLNNYIIDIENMIGFMDNVGTAKNRVKVMRTVSNDRRRSRLSAQKGNGFDFTFINTYKETFAKEIGEFAYLWRKTYNGGSGNYPTPRQVLTGIHQFLDLQVELHANLNKQERIPQIKKTLMLTFLNVEAMLAFPDMDK